MAELKTLVCSYCGNSFKQLTYKQIYCNSDCRNGVNNKKRRDRRAGTRKKKGISELHRLARESREAGMTYGQYVAMKGV